MTAHIHLYDVSFAHIRLRLFEPRAISLAQPMFGVPAMTRLPPASPCLLCSAEAIPALMGWAEVFGDQRMFIVCSDCADAPETDLEQTLLDKLGLQPSLAAPSSSRSRSMRSSSSVFHL
jgi:hypothetical protein